MQNKKVGFFTRIKKAILKFDEYEKFMEESLGKAFKYFFKLMLVFSLFVTIALTYNTVKNVNKTVSQFKNEFPEFEISDGALNVASEEAFELYVDEYNLQFVMDSTKESYEENDYENSIVMLKNSMIMEMDGYKQEIGYNDIGDISKQTIIDSMKSKELIAFYVVMFLVMLLVNFIVYSIVIFFDVITLSILALIINLFIKTKFKYKDLLKLSIYAITLPVILYMLYSVANVFFGTTIKVFEYAYDAISYIYVITVMFMLKSDAIKNTQELQKIKEEQKKVKEELEREKQEEKEKKEEKEPEEKEKKERKKEKTPETPQTDNG